MRNRINDRLGKPLVIVNNAVIQYSRTSVLEQPSEDYEGRYRSCVLHNLYMAKCFVPDMIEEGWGRVIGINTECSLQCWPGQSAYVTGKHGMSGLLQTLAKEVGGNGITVNQVAPGWMLSNGERGTGGPDRDAEKLSEDYAKMLPLKHRGEDRDIANAVVFLSSDLARFITGAIIPLNGGGATIPAWS